MKKLLLINLLFLITPYAKADMDYICFTAYEDGKDISEYISKNCERNNILRMEFIKGYSVLNEIASWCRHDREINYSEMFKLNTNNFNQRYILVCVLYDNKPRTIIVSN